MSLKSIQFNPVKYCSHLRDEETKVPSVSELSKVTHKARSGLRTGSQAV